LTSPDNSRPSSRRGLLLVAMLLALSLLSLAVVGLVVAGGQLADIDRRRLDVYRAEYNADATAALALREIASNTDHDIDGLIGGISDDGNAGTGPSLNGAPLNASISPPDTRHLITIQSTVQQIARRHTLITQRAGHRKPGLLATYFFATPTYPINNTDFTLPPSYVGTIPNLDWANTTSASDRMFPGHPTNITGQFTGFITIPATGLWNFHADADDDVQLLINGQSLFIRGGGGPCARFNGSINLTAGTHTYELRWNDGSGSQCLTAYWTPPSGTMAVIPPHAFSHAMPPNRAVPALVTNTTMALPGTTDNTNIQASAWNAAFGPITPSLIQPGLAHAATNSASASAITLQHGTIDGFLESAPGSDPNTAITITAPGTAAGRRASTYRYAIPRLTAPTGMPASSGALSISSGTTTIDGDRTFSSLTVSAGILRFTQSARIHITGDFNLENLGQITFDPGIVVTFYIAGNAVIRQDTRFNPSMDPHRASFYMIGSATSLSIRSTLGACGHFFNPMGSINVDEDTPWPLLSGTFQAATLTVIDKTLFQLDTGPLGTETPILRIGAYSDQ
jgi:hypothetical protein